MAPRYRVTLAAEERQELEALTRAATKTTGKRFLFAAGAAVQPGVAGHAGVWPARRALGSSASSEQGLEAALGGSGRGRPGKVIFDGAFEARLVALACSQAPPGRNRWTLRLLAERAVELGWVGRVPVMTVHRAIKKL